MSQQIQITGGAKVRDLQDVIIGTSGVLSSVAFDVANGVPKLDSNGKILVSQLPNSVMEYKGTWNAATNTPTLANGTGNQGDVYLCNVAGTVNFGAGPISFIVGDSAVYSGSIWQRSGGATGSVTSVGLSTNAGAITIGNSPITTSGVISANFNGTNLQYVNGAGNLTTFPTLMTSVGLTMPSAFTVTNSPLTGAGGTLSVTGAGTTAQYIRGDGSLATFPTIATEAQRLVTEVYNETGATLTKGTVVYINGGHGNLPTITKAIATGDATSAQTYGIVQTDITNNNNGYVVVIGSLGDLDTQAYANGTQLYLSSTTAGAWTSTKQYAPAHLVYVAIVTRSHPTQGVVEVRIQNGFELDELHNVSAQSPLNNQGLFYNTSTSLWENKSIATALGYTPANDASVVHLTGNETIGGTKTFSDATKNNGGIFLQNASSSSLAGYMNLGGLTNGVKFTSGGGISNSFTLPSATGYDYTFPNGTGTIALTSNLSSYVPYTGATSQVDIDYYTFLAGNIYSKQGSFLLNQTGTRATTAGYTTFASQTASGKYGFIIDNGNTGVNQQLLFNNAASYIYTFPNATGTIALVGGSGVGTVTSVAALTIGTSGTDLSSTVATSTTTPVITLNVPTASATNRGALSSADWSTFNSKQGTITLTTTGTSGAATFSSNTLNIPQYQGVLTNPVTGTGTTNYLPKFTGASTIGNSAITDDGTTVTLVSRALSGTSASFSSTVTISSGASDAQFLATTTGLYSYFSVQKSNAVSTLGRWNAMLRGDTYFGNTANALIFLGERFNASSVVDGYYMPLALQPNGNVIMCAGSNVLANGLVGIGTSIPNVILEVGGLVADVTKTVFRSSLAVAPTAYYNDITAIYSGASAQANKLQINYANGYTSGTGIVLQGDGKVGIGMNAPLARLHILAPTNDIALRFQQQNDPTSQYYFNIDSAVNGALSLVTNYLGGTAVGFSQSRAANVSIGTTTDAGYKLDVNGTGRFSYADNSYGAGLTVKNTTNNTAAQSRIDIANSANNLLVLIKNSPSVNSGVAYVGTSSTESLTLGVNYATALTIASTGAATFSSSVTAVGGNMLIASDANYSGYSAIGFGGSVANGSAKIFAANANNDALYVCGPTGQGITFRVNGTAEIVKYLSNGNTILGNSGGNVLIGTTTDATGKLQVNGTIYATGFYESSDIRFKNIIETNPTINLSGIDVIKFTRKDNDTNQVRYGYSAQQVQSILPDAVTGTDFLNVNYLDVHTLKIAQLEQEIKELKAKMN